jgi:hypothetical protein
MQCSPYQFQGWLGFGEQVVVPDAQGADAVLFEIGVARPISVCLLDVLPAIKFDSEALLVAVEVQYVGRQRVLAAELEATEGAVAQQVPEELLGICLIDAQAAGAAEYVVGEF